MDEEPLSFLKQDATAVAAIKPRCNQCQACQNLTDKHPEFFPMILKDTSASRTKAWNQLLVDNPCEQWTPEEQDRFTKTFHSCAYNVRPRRLPE